MRIVVFSDGTGNSSAKLFRTNVWRLYDALDLGNGAGQVAYYDNGVGTAALKPLALLGGAFGWGLKRNVLDIYKFICRNYATEGPHEIHAFGFSRGAFTIRVLLGLIRRQGLVPYTGDERDLARQATWAYRRYREQAAPSMGLVWVLRRLRNAFLHAFDAVRREPTAAGAPEPLVPPIQFVGLWDSVAAYGFPIVEITRAWDTWVWPISLPTRDLSWNVEKACHALALDDERQTFHPLLWDESKEPTVQPTRDGKGAFAPTIGHERVSQVWFSGMHSNVGGGYPDDGMAYDSLCWIAEHAVARGLTLKPGTLDGWHERRTPSSPMADSRAGMAAYYRYLPRSVAGLSNDALNEVAIARPKIHVSVFDRIATGVAGYAPISLPASYALTDGNAIFDLPAPADVSPNSSAPAFESPGDAALRYTRQQDAWDAVWYRRVSYFLTIAATLVVLALPFLQSWLDDHVQPLPLASLSALLGLVEGFVPASLGLWLAHFKEHPVQLVLGAAVIVGLMSWSTWVEHRLTDTMRRAWHGQAPTIGGIWIHIARAIRTSSVYIWTVDLFRYRLAPHALGIPILALMLVTGFSAVVRLWFDGAVLAGGVCHDSGGASWRASDARTPLPVFDATQACQPMTATVEQGAVYEITSDATGLDWRDRELPVTRLKGFEWWDVPSPKKWPFAASLPLRRHPSINWFVPIVRIGARGDEHYALTRETRWFRARANGEVFMYVNDAIWFYPWLPFYANNDNTGDRARPPRFSIRRVTDAEIERCGAACPW